MEFFIADIYAVIFLTGCKYIQEVELLDENSRFAVGFSTKLRILAMFTMAVRNPALRSDLKRETAQIII